MGQIRQLFFFIFVASGNALSIILENALTVAVRGFLAGWMKFKDRIDACRRIADVHLIELELQTVLVDKPSMTVKA